MVRLQGAKLRDQRGFTLIEMMIVVAVIAILAIVVVPQFFRESAKTKAISEVAPMFSEIAIREEQYKIDNPTYLDLTACPATPSTAGIASSTCQSVTYPGWVELRINPPESLLRCSYQVVTGNAVGTNNPNGFVFTSPAANWYYMIATCDMDNSSTVNATFFASSVDSAIQKLNEGN